MLLPNIQKIISSSKLSLGYLSLLDCYSKISVYLSLTKQNKLKSQIHTCFKHPISIINRISINSKQFTFIFWKVRNSLIFLVDKLFFEIYIRYQTRINIYILCVFELNYKYLILRHSLDTAHHILPPIHYSYLHCIPIHISRLLCHDELHTDMCLALL